MMNEDENELFNVQALNPLRNLNEHRQSTGRGARLKLCGKILGLIGALMIVLPSVLSFSRGPIDHKKGFYRLLFSAAGAVPLVAGLWMFSRGRRLSAPGANRAMSRDRRAPILLLRAFADDNLTYVERSRSSLGRLFGFRTAFGWLVGSGGTTTFEELVSRELSDLGPIIAIGRPGETLPPLGAARLWVSNDEWQNRVEELLADCQLVVMILGETKGEDGLAWEIRQLFTLSQPEKVLLVIPPLPAAEIEKRWEQYRLISDGKIPAAQGDELLLTFTTGWKCSVRSAKGKRDHQAYEKAFDRLRFSRLSRFGEFDPFPESVEISAGQTRCPHCGVVLDQSEAEYSICACRGESLTIVVNQP